MLRFLLGLFTAFFLLLSPAPSATNNLFPSPSLSKTNRALVYVFLATDCPIAQKQAPTLARLEKQYKSQGVIFQGIFPNSTETKEKITQWGYDRKIHFSLVLDDNHLAQKLQATTTPEVFLTNPAGRIFYQGNVESLPSALTAFLANKPIKVAKTTPIGCLLTPTASVKSVKKDSSVTYAEQIAPLLNKNCVSCHRAGEVGAMPLDSYAKAKAWATQIVRVTQDKTMPPWKADVQESGREFRDEKRLEERQKQLLKQWAEAGMPLGDTTKILPLPVFLSSDAWQLGKPDAVFSVPKPFTTPREGKDVYRCFVIPLKNKKDLWLKGVEFKPGNRSVVHHVSLFADTSGAARKLDTQDTSPGYTNPTPGNGPGFSTYFATLGGWTPGHNPIKLPEGVGLLVPKDADLVLEVHYALNGKEETDQTQFGLYYASETEELIDKRLHIGAIGATKLTLPAGEKNIEIKGDDFCPQDITLFSITPHMHFLGTRMIATAHLPDGTRMKLIDVPQWYFNWQPSYRFQKPIKLPRSTHIMVTAYYDNSAENPFNPNKPPKEVIWGESTKDEMCSCFIAYTKDSEHLANTNTNNSAVVR